MGWTFYNSSGQILTVPASTATADLATEVTISANNTANETVYPVFIDGATGTQGLESDTGLTYNPSTGLLTSTGFSGNLNGGAVGTSSAVTELQVDYINANASTLTITDSSDTGDKVTIAVGSAGATTVTTVDDDGSAADLTLDVDGEIVIDAADAAGVILKINGTAQLSVVDGSITPTANNDIDLGASSYQFKNGYFDGTLEADIITIGGTNVVTGSLITTLGTVSAGTWQGSVVAAAYLPDAGAAAQGVAELAVAAEINTGTDSTRIMPIDQYVASNRNIRYVFYRIVAAATDVATATTVGGDFEFPFTGTIIEVGTFNDTAGITGTQVVDIHKGGTTIMSSDKCDTDTTEKTTRSAANPPALTTTAITEGDILTFDIDAIHSGTAAKGLTVRLEVRVT